MRRLRLWDGVATAAVIALAIPYIGYLVRGSMPLIHDERGLAGLGLALALVGFMALGRARVPSILSPLDAGLQFGTLAIGVIALALSETLVGTGLVAVFMLAIFATWAIEILEHAGARPPRFHWHHQ